MKAETAASRVILSKIARLKKGGHLRVLDLFAGCGGMSLGFRAAGYDLAGSVEIDASAALTYARNFHPDMNENDPRLAAKDIINLEPDDLAKIYEYKSTGDAIDVVVGGPPCQSYSRVGRAKIQHLSQKSVREDYRSTLYLRYLHYVKEFRPLVILMENVPEITNFQGTLTNGELSIPHELGNELVKLGYRPSYTILNSASYGVPQFRTRFFMVALANELKVEPSFPAPTHFGEIPKSYSQTKKMVKNAVRFDLFGQDFFYQDAPAPSNDAKPFITSHDALGDLPVLRDHLEETFDPKLRTVTSKLKMPPGMGSQYASLMRNWNGFSSRTRTTGHVSRNLRRDFPIFARMKPGDKYPEALKHAEDIFVEKLKALHPIPQPGSAEFESIKARTVPPYPNDKFEDKWRMLDPRQPSHTLVAHMSRDSYGYIHYDNTQARTITVREAARLQSFPDGFEFGGGMGPAFKQIGNSVPPLLALALAREIKQSIEKAIAPKGTRKNPADLAVSI